MTPASPWRCPAEHPRSDGPAPDPPDLMPWSSAPTARLATIAASAIAALAGVEAVVDEHHIDTIIAGRRRTGPIGGRSRRGRGRTGSRRRSDPTATSQSDGWCDSRRFWWSSSGCSACCSAATTPAPRSPSIGPGDCKCWDPTTITVPIDDRRRARNGRQQQFVQHTAGTRTGNVHVTADLGHGRARRIRERLRGHATETHRGIDEQPSGPQHRGGHDDRRRIELDHHDHVGPAGSAANIDDTVVWFRPGSRSDDHPGATGDTDDRDITDDGHHAAPDHSDDRDSDHDHGATQHRPHDHDHDATRTDPTTTTTVAAPITDPTTTVPPPPPSTPPSTLPPLP